MLFRFLEYWWGIYAPFEPVSVTMLDDTFVHPHYGQVIRYTRCLRRKTKQDVARALHWSPNYIRKIEASSEGTNHIDRNGALITHLQIPPLLIGMDEERFLLNERSGMEVVETPGEIERFLQVHQRRRVPSFAPLRVEEMHMYNQALHECQKLLFFSSDMDALEPLLERKPHKSISAYMHRYERFADIDEGSMKRLRERRSFVRARQGVVMIEHWCEQLTRALKCATGFRYDQLMYVQYYLYKLVAYDYLLSEEAIAEVGSKRKFAYVTGRVECAQRLGNVMLMAEALTDRARLYFDAQQSDLALEDIARMLPCLDIMCNVLERAGNANAYLGQIYTCLSRAQGSVHVKLRTLYARAQKIVQARESDMLLS